MYLSPGQAIVSAFLWKRCVSNVNKRGCKTLPVICYVLSLRPAFNKSRVLHKTSWFSRQITSNLVEKKFGRNIQALTFALRLKKRCNEQSERVITPKRSEGHKIFESWETIALLDVLSFQIKDNKNKKVSQAKQIRFDSLIKKLFVGDYE